VAGSRATLFTHSHRQQLNDFGVTRVESVIPQDYAHAVLRALPVISSIHFDNPSTWYSLPAEYPGIIPSHHHQSQWDIRQHPRLHQTFSELWETQMLWVTMDRIGFVPPLRPGEEARCELHWDMDPRATSAYQAIVYLTDVPLERAPFTAVPSIFRDLDAWLGTQPELDFAKTDFSSETAVPVPGHAGDLIIWNSKLPHGPGANRSPLPRVMLAVTMFPAEESPLRASTSLTWSRSEQIEWWRTKRAPPWWRDVPNQRDPEPGPTALLTDLGRRLVGIEKWSAGDSEEAVLTNNNAISFVATRNPSAARSFYEGVLGLRLVADEHFALVFDVNGRMLRIAKTEDLTPAAHTVLGWEVEAIDAKVKELGERGVAFLRFDGLSQDALGIWTSPSGAKVAWFKDPDGNSLSLTQFSAAGAR
jgi:catechol 2,3-dioxygenase-like lactoylglutathione lyase family enzyme